MWRIERDKMAGDEVRLKNGQRWTAKDFVDHYKMPTASGGRGSFDEPQSDRGIGRIYHPFTAPQLSAALRKEFVYPGSAPLGLLPSYTAAPPPAMKEHFQYLDRTNID
jgi:hypothetical protein